MEPTDAQLAAAPQQPARSQQPMQAEAEARRDNREADQQEDDEAQDRVSYQVGCTLLARSCCMLHSNCALAWYPIGPMVNYLYF